MSVELYDSQHPQAAKWLLPDGTVTYQLPIMGAVGGAGGGGGGTLNHAELINLDFAHSGHTGFASQDQMNRESVRIDEAHQRILNVDIRVERLEGDAFHGVPYVEEQFVPGLWICRVQRGPIFSYWIRGEYAGAQQLTLPPGTFIAQPGGLNSFDEFWDDQQNKPDIEVTVGRAGITGADKFDTAIFSFHRDGLRVSGDYVKGLTLYPADKNYSASRILFAHTRVLEIP